MNAISIERLFADPERRRNLLGESLPLSEARSLPPAAYTDPALSDAEQARIFRPGWLCIANAAQLRANGDFVTGNVAGAPVVALRDWRGEILVLSNVCAHRAAQLLNGTGNVERIVCPYHAWCYDLWGRLIAAPHMASREDPRLADCKLRRVRHEVWHGWIYACLEADTPALTPKLRGLSQALEPYRVADMKVLFSEEEEWPVNWKCLAENFMESYHVSCVHPRTVARATPTSSVTCQPGGGSYCWHTLRIRRDLSELTDFDRTLEPALSDTEILACVFPSHLISVTARGALSLSVQPMAVDRLQVLATYSVARGYLTARAVSVEILAHEAREAFKRFNAEDRAIVARVAAGHRSPLATAGPLSELERPLWDFHRFWRSTLTARQM